MRCSYSMEHTAGTPLGQSHETHNSLIDSLKSHLRKERKFMSQNNGRAKRSEKGLLTPDNCVVAFIDHQPQMLFATANFDRQSIINNTVALAKATRIFDVPVVLTTVESKSFSGYMWPQLKAVFSGTEPHRAFLDEFVGRQELRRGDRENR